MRTSILVLLLTACDVASIEPAHKPSFEPVEPAVAEEPSAAEALRRQLLAQGVDAMPPAPVLRPALVELGRALAFDKEFSGNRDLSCMTCHATSLGTGDDRPLPSGVGGTGLGVERTDGAMIPRNAPPMYNLHAMDSMFWDGRVESQGVFVTSPAGDQLTWTMRRDMTLGPAAVQALFPFTSRHEMRGEHGESELGDLDDTDFTGIWNALLARAMSHEGYRNMFQAAWPNTPLEDIHWGHAAEAIAGFEVAAFEASDTPFDRFLRGDDDALTPAAFKGAELFFGEAGCSDCHSGVALSDESFHNTGLPQFGPGKGHGASGTDDQGRFGVTGHEADAYRFRTPPLRNIALTAPYGHAGQFPTLEAFVGHYVDIVESCETYPRQELPEELDASWVDNADAVLSTLSPELTTIEPEDVGWLVSFLEALTDPGSLDDDLEIPDTVPSGLPVPD